MEKYQEFIRRAVRLGATDAKTIKTSSVVTAPWVRWKCRYGCGMYGTSLCCPPNSPTYKETRELLDSYKHAILIHLQKGFDFKTHPTKIVATLEREIFLAGYHKAFALGEGPCMICGGCNLEQCVHPSEARPSMESFGIDVYTTVRNSGFFIEVLRPASRTGMGLF